MLLGEAVATAEVELEATAVAVEMIVIIVGVSELVSIGPIVPVLEPEED